jgi:hypothetical protein
LSNNNESATGIFSQKFSDLNKALASVENVFDNVLERENNRQAIDANDLGCFSMNSVYIYVMWTVTMVKERSEKTPFELIPN